MPRFLLALLLLVGLAACAVAPDVRVDQDRTADFSRYRSFGWADPLGTDRSGYTTLTTGRLKAAVQREMFARGYSLSATPDLLVNFHGRLQERTQVQTVPAISPIGYYGYRGYGAWPGYAFGATTFVDQYTEGTVNVDLVDRARNTLVWEGVAVAEVTSQDRADPAERLDRSVAAIFARYPYRAGVGTPVLPPR
ncbi:MAG: putative lipoprotein [Rubritepida sp.]|nr:putative lipoprotein [Rubritepida sp.]